MLTPLIGPERYPFVTLFAAFTVASWYSGLRPALVAVFTGALAGHWLFVSPRFTLLPRGLDSWVGLAMVVATGVLIALLGEAMRQARSRDARSLMEARRSHAALEDSEARARAVLDTVVTGIVSIDERGRIQTFNHAAERMFGYRAAEVLDQNVKVLMPPPYREEHDAYLAAYLRTGVAKVIGSGREVTGRRKDGSTFPVDLAVNDTVLHDHHLFTAVLRDLSEQKGTEERERQLERRASQRERLADIGAMTARIAHDLGNPLAGLSMIAQRIVRRIAAAPSAPAESLREAVSAIVSTTRQLDELIIGFKDFAREQRLDLREVRLPRLLQEIAALWEAEAVARGIALAVEVSPDVPAIQADAEKLRRVFDNLLRNALEAVDRGPGLVRIAINVSAHGNVRITVEDTGSGVPEGLDVFGLFETTKVAGTGLGLAICKQIVLAHGGGIAFASRLPQGTVFYVDLPCDPLSHRSRPPG
jgi:two-component system sensor kinase FixL